MSPAPHRAPAHTPPVRTPMRTFRRAVIAPALLLSALWGGPLRADPAAELVVGLGAPRPGGTTAAQRARFAERLSALGLAPRGTLADGLGLSKTSARAASPRSGAMPNPFDLDPTRVWRVTARDPIAARAAIAPLAADPEVEWIEPNQPRGIAALAAAGAPRSAAGNAALDP